MRDELLQILEKKRDIQSKLAFRTIRSNPQVYKQAKQKSLQLLLQINERKAILKEKERRDV